MMIKAKCTQTMLDAVLHVWCDAILCSVNVCCGFFLRCAVLGYLLCYATPCCAMLHQYIFMLCWDVMCCYAMICRALFAM